MATVQRFGTWVLVGASGSGTYTIPRGSSMYQDVDLTGVATVSLQYRSDIESWSHFVVKVDATEILNEKRYWHENPPALLLSE